MNLDLAVTFRRSVRFMVRSSRVEGPTTALSASSDAELMLAYGAGRAEAFDLLFERYRERIYNYLHRRLSDRAAAEDLLQATFVRVIEARDRYEASATFATWIYTIATNLARDHARRAESRRNSGAALRIESAEGARREAAPRPGLRRALERAIESLPEHEKEAFLLGKYEGRSYDEIARILDCSEGAVKVRVHRAMKALRHALGEWLE